MLYGTVDYFSDCLTTSMMNRLVNEHANSLKGCYQQLLEEIVASQKPKALRLKHLDNLEQAYKLVLDHLMGMGETR